MKRVQMLLALLAGVLIGLSLWVFQTGESVEVLIPPGSNATSVGYLLAKERVIKSPRLFKVLAKLSRLDRSLKPGTYPLRRRMSSLEALWRLQKGGYDFVRVTIPEGWRATQIAARLDVLGVTESDAFMDVVMEQGLEGYLYPTTYFLSLGMPPESVARVMKDEFERRIGPILQRPMPPLLNPHRVMTMASIVEREAVLPQERPLIARVYLNRLQKHWPLEADPTVQYALGYWKKNLRYRDLEVDSPYNTYRYPGIPPGPICSPSAHSVEAVLDPVESEAMYFVADNTGGHTFHRTFAEHVKSKNKAKAERLEAARRVAAGLPPLPATPPAPLPPGVAERDKPQ
jgi:UPF0755 protein